MQLFDQMLKPLDTIVIYDYDSNLHFLINILCCF
jgi:hypothetical protein